MAEGNESQEKTEEPTPKRREKAKEDGQVVTSKEMFVFMSMMGGMLVLLSTLGWLPNLQGYWAHYLTIGSSKNLDALIITRIGEMLSHIAIIGFVVGIPVILMVIGTQAAMGGLIFSPKAMRFNPGKLNPAKGLKRMVSMQALVELIKAILKVLLLTTAAASVIYPLLGGIINMSSMAPGDSAQLFGTAMIRIVSALLIGLAIIGGIDLGYQIYSNAQKLKMSRQEVKDENKEAEGSPELKGKIRQKQFEASQRAAKNRASLADVPKATAVITNPTHFAIALKYVPGEDVAPVILAMGKGPLAHEIMDLAKSSRVRMLQVPPLARALYFTGDIGQEINYALYTAVATILAYVYRLEAGDWDTQPDVTIPQELDFDEFGHKKKES